MNKLQETICSLSDLDYETLDSIRAQLNETMGSMPTEIELHNAITELFKNGELILYIYNGNSYEELTDIKNKNIN